MAPFGDFVCECANTTCDARIGLTFAEYEARRSHPRRFAVLNGHAVPEIEDVIEENDRYTVVEKSGAAGAVAEKLHPRSRATL